MSPQYKHLEVILMNNVLCILPHMFCNLHFDWTPLPDLWLLNTAYSIANSKITTQLTLY